MAVTPLGTPSVFGGTTATPTAAHTVGSGSNVVSYIFVFASGGATISSMNTFGGVAPVLVGSFNGELFAYRVVSPAAGATTAQANLSSAVLTSLHVMTVQGANLSDPDDTVVTGSNSELPELLAPPVTSETDDLVVAFGYMVSDTIAAAGGATLSTEYEAIDGSFLSSAVVYEAGAASVSLGVGSTATFGDNSIIAFNINTASGGSTALARTVGSKLVKSPLVRTP